MIWSSKHIDHVLSWFSQRAIRDGESHFDLADWSSILLWTYFLFFDFTVVYLAIWTWHLAFQSSLFCHFDHTQCHPAKRRKSRRDLLLLLQPLHLQRMWVRSKVADMQPSPTITQAWAHTVLQSLPKASRRHHPRRNGRSSPPRRRPMINPRVLWWSIRSRWPES